MTMFLKSGSVKYLLVIFLAVVVVSLLFVRREGFFTAPNASTAFKNCWKDAEKRALPNAQGTLKGNAEEVKSQCMNLAIKNKDNVFGIQYGGQCFTGRGNSYKKYGRGTGCSDMGGTWEQLVFKVGSKVMPAPISLDS
jgi:hypothetical protein